MDGLGNQLQTFAKHFQPTAYWAHVHACCPFPSLQNPVWLARAWCPPTAEALGLGSRTCDTPSWVLTGGGLARTSLHFRWLPRVGTVIQQTETACCAAHVPHALLPGNFGELRPNLYPAHQRPKGRKLNTDGAGEVRNHLGLLLARQATGGSIVSRSQRATLRQIMLTARDFRRQDGQGQEGLVPGPSVRQAAIPVTVTTERCPWGRPP